MSKSETHEFKAEIQQLLDIVIHSLYTDKEIFIRELISNAADALEKLRFEQSSGTEVADPNLEPLISIDTDEKERSITISDTGIGMTEEELKQNLGMIAHSGSKAFIKQLKEAADAGAKPDANLIGQFGVGFYSAFMVAEKVTVHTRSFKADGGSWIWTSSGAGTFEIRESDEKLPRGTRIVVELTKDEKEYATEGRVESIIGRYSKFVPFPINLNGKRQNTVQALWTRNKSEIKDEEYTEFYHFMGHDTGDPMYRLHFSADAPLSIKSLFFVPSRNYEMPGMPQMEPQTSLYCRKVMIDSSPKKLLPEWLRFIKGVVDSEDLPLNISRETMQDSSLVAKLNSVLSRRIIKFLNERAEKDPDKFKEFYKEFGKFIAEGVMSDFANKDELGKLLRYESSKLDAGEVTSLAEYVTRMPEDQKEIYYLIAPNREGAQASPYYEVFEGKKLEVLFLYEPWDEFAMDHLAEFDGKKLVSAERAELELKDEEKQVSEEKLDEKQSEALAKWLAEKLGDRVNEVRVSNRLLGSPAMVLESDKYMTSSMRRMMKAMKQDLPPEKVDLEINPGHAIMVRLFKQHESNPELAEQAAHQILDNARALAGLLEDPRQMIQRVNELLERVLA